MQPPPIPDNEEQRIAALREFEILDTAREASFDEIAALAAEVAKTPIALISFVDSQRQWFKACVGFDKSETTREVAFCAHVVGDGERMMIEDTALDTRFVDNPLVTESPNLRAYAGFPLRTRSPEGARARAVNPAARSKNPPVGLPSTSKR